MLHMIAIIIFISGAACVPLEISMSHYICIIAT